MVRRLAAALVLSLAVSATSLGAQQARGVVRDSASGLPIPGAVVMTLDGAGRVGRRSITDERGTYRITLDAQAQRLRVLRLGFRPREVAPPAAVDGVVTVDVVMTSIPLLLSQVRIKAASGCPRRADRSAALALLEQARAGLLATVVARSERAAQMVSLLTERTFDERGRIIRQRVSIDSASTIAAFGAAQHATDFVARGFTTDSLGVQIFFAPDADVLLDDAFARGYCFHLADRERDRPNQVGLGFRAADRRSGRVDVDGALWIDTAARALVGIDFRYRGLDPRIERLDPGGHVGFRAMANAVVLIDAWALRLVTTREETTLYTVDARTSGDPLRPAEPALLLQERGGELARARWPDGVTWQASLGMLDLVTQTKDGAPAPGVVVRLAETDYTATSDSTGRLTIRDLAPGPYAVAIADPRLSPIHFDIPTALAFVAVRDSTHRASVIAPTTLDYVAERCRVSRTRAGGPGDPTEGGGTGWFIGRIMDPDGAPIQGAFWNVAKRLGADARPVLSNAMTSDDGIIQFCGLPRNTSIVVTVSRPGFAPARATGMLADPLTVIPIVLTPRP